MKKVYLLLFALVAGSAAFAQSFANAGMESWRTTTSGGILGGPVDTVHAPIAWYGFDSLIISLGETYGHDIGAGEDWNPQLFPDSVTVHTGAYSAKLITVTQDVLGNIPGMLSNAVISFDVNTYELTNSVADALTFSGGTPISQRIGSVSAWVKYSSGLDTAGTTGLDTASLTVLVYSTIDGVDSVVGTDTVMIFPGTSWQNITAHVKYTDSLNGADTVRILFMSSNNAGLDSSTLNVDDVSVTYMPYTAVKNIATTADVKVYPNPASDKVFVEGSATGKINVFDVNGAVVASRFLNGQTTIDISAIADGLYFYSISDNGGHVVQRGKLSVVR